MPAGGPETTPVFADVPPTRSDILKEVGTGALDARSRRAKRFAELLTERYRNQLYAVRVIIRPEGHIELRCGANMTRRQMAEVVSHVQEDARAVFGSYVPLILFETYAAGPQRRIGEVIIRPDTTQVVLRFTAPPQRISDL